MSAVLASLPQSVATRLDHLSWLESESICILREVAAQCSKPALLFSGGKDSCVVLRLAEKAFRPGRLPFPLLHIDTGHNFPEVLAFRDERAHSLGETLIVRSVEGSIARGSIRLRGPLDSRNAAQSVTLLEAIEEFGFDALIGVPARRGKGARQRAHVQFPRQLRPVGSEEPAAGTVGSV
jgi:sulfate adenylyltransferase subunit 2